MKRFIIVTAMVLTLAAVAGASRADAAFWPANCRSSATLGQFARCVDNHLNNLHRRLKAAVAVNATQTRRLNAQASVNATQTRRLNNHAALFACEEIVPLTQYGDPAGSAGYEFNDGVNPTFLTTALDATAQGDTVDAWFVVDVCETATTPRASLPSGVNLRPHLPK
jgi:hypothetical protein